MSKEGTRLLKNIGYNVKGIQSNIGLEQEFFLIPRDSFARRLDLQMTGRTVMGKNAVSAMPPPDVSVPQTCPLPKCLCPKHIASSSHLHANKHIQTHVRIDE
jgi:hypothetical protein